MNCKMPRNNHNNYDQYLKANFLFIFTKTTYLK